MSSILVIARRELRERSFIFLTALGVAILPYLIALMPGAKSLGRGEVVGAVGLTLAVAFALGLSIILGSSIVGRELGDGRLSFYFSKPIPAASIWFGKLIAALFAIVATFAMIGLPAFLGAGQKWRAVWTMQSLEIGSVLLHIAVLLFLVSHAATTMVRSRTPLVLLDFVFLSVTAGAMWMIARPLLNALAMKLARGVTLTIVVAITLTLAVAPAWQLSRGRTDRRRNHFELSRVVWISVAAILVVAAAYVGWVVSADPADLTSDFNALQSPAGPWFFVGGQAKGRFDYHTTFLVNAANGEHARVPAPYIWHAAFTHDGRTAYWLRPVGVRPTHFRAQLWYRRLDIANAQTVATNIETGPNTEVVMSDDLSRLAVIDGSVLTIHDLAHDRIVGSVKLPQTAPARQYRMYFVGPDVVRVIDQSLGSVKEESVALNIYEFDAPRRALARTGGATFATKNAYFSASADGSRLLVRMYPTRRAAVIDARTGATVVEWPTGTAGAWPQFLSDGSLAGFTREANGFRFRTITTSGAIVSEVLLPGWERASFAREIAPGKVLAWLSRPGSRAVIIDVKRGVVEQSVDGLRVVMDAGSTADPRRAPIDASQPIVGMDAAGSLVRWNPATGERTVLVKRG